MMNHRAAFREHRIPTSLERHVGDSAMDAGEILRRARDVYHEGRGVYFTADQLAAMPWDQRMSIEVQARRLYGPRQRR